MWQRRKQTAAAPAEELSAWIVDTSSAWLLLANDATETVKFTRHLPGSSPADSGADSGTDGGGEADGAAAAPSNANEQTLEAGGRQWVRTPFQVPLFRVLPPPAHAPSIGFGAHFSMRSAMIY